MITLFFFFNDTATTEIYTYCHTLSLHDALPISMIVSQTDAPVDFSKMLSCRVANIVPIDDVEIALRSVSAYTQTIGIYPEELKRRSEEHTSELQSLMRISYAVFCLKKKKKQ